MPIDPARSINLSHFVGLKSRAASVIIPFVAFMAGLGAWAPPGSGWIGLAIMPALVVGTARTPSAGAAVVACFYVGAAWRIVPSVLGFGAGLGTAWTALLVTVAGHALIAWLAMQFTNRLRQSPSRVAVRIGLYLAMTTLPPAGYLLLLPPIASAGAWFPGMSYVGLLLLYLTCVQMSILYVQRRSNKRGAMRVLTVLVLLIAIAGNARDVMVQEVDRGALSNWHAIDMQLSPLPDNADLQARTTRHTDVIALVEKSARSMGAVNFITPENITGQWDAAASYLWQPLIRELHDRGQSVVVGAVQVTDGSNSNSYRKGLSIHAAQIRTQSSTQRTSVPNYHFFAAAQPVPLFEAGAEWNWSVRGRTVVVNGKAVAPIICFEALTAWPMLTGIGSSDVTTVHINAWWDRARVRMIQRKAARTWGRLFGVPIFTAINHPQQRE